TNNRFTPPDPQRYHKVVLPPIAATMVSGGRLKIGSRVDCLFGDGYFRGTVDAISGGEPRFRVVFDDGDVRKDVPPEDIKLLLEPGCRVECLYEDEDAYFDGSIAKDNGDATYQVDFDDGDVLSAAPRHNIRLVSMPATTTDDDDPQRKEDKGGEIDDAARISDLDRVQSNGELQGGQHGGDAGDASFELAVGDNSGRRQEQPSSRNGPQKYSTSTDGRAVNNNRAPNDPFPSSLMTAPYRSGFTAGDNNSERNHGARLGRERARSFAERSRGQQLAPESKPESPFTTTIPNPLHAHLDALAVAAPRLLVDAPPDFRLWAVCHRIAALEDQLRQQEARGEAWNLPVFSEMSTRNGRCSYQTGKADQLGSPDLERAPTEGDNEEPTSHGAKPVNVNAAEPSFPAHAELRKVVDDLSALRMRQVALVRLCYGDVSLEMVQAITDLADGYAKEGLWPQVSNHMARAANILASDQDARFRSSDAFAVGGPHHAWGSAHATAPGRTSRLLGIPGSRPRGAAWDDRSARLIFPTEDRYSDPAMWCSLSPGRCARLLLELFESLRRNVILGAQRGLVVRGDLEALLGTHRDKTLRSAAPGLVKGSQMPPSCEWGVAVDCLRQNSSSYADLNLKVLEGAHPKQAAKIRLAFQAADPESTGCADAQLLLSELHTRFSHNDGNFLEALLPDLLSAVADLAHVDHREDTAEDRQQPDSEKAEVAGPPISWEEVLALTVAVNEDEQAVDGGMRGTAREKRRSLLSVRVKLLTGRHQTHTNSLPAACRSLSEALAVLERLDLGEASGCVPVLNALTDALALTHRRHKEKSASKAKKLAQAWIQGKEGQELWKQECKRLLTECRRRLEVVPRAEIETRTWQALVAYRSKVLAQELIGQGKELDTAEDYLVRAWEILESRHGRINPDVGAACVSLGNLAIIRRRQDEAIDWFRRALGTFEECFSDGYTPVTAGTSVTLGNLLIKQGTGTDATADPRANQVLHEAIELMEKAAKFYSGRVEKEVANREKNALLNPRSSNEIEDAFAWSDPSLLGSCLDPQTADFARRAAELWTQTAGLREFAIDLDAKSGNGAPPGTGPEFLATALKQAARATAVS
ncbi:unnamed protein product, partial [Scytosiphon promiscuus]